MPGHGMMLAQVVQQEKLCTQGWTQVPAQAPRTALHYTGIGLGLNGIRDCGGDGPGGTTLPN
eukprot:6815872-Karenia_brevis.AAC.1